MVDVVVDPDGAGGLVTRRLREVRPGEHAQEVVLAQPLAGAEPMPVIAGVPGAADVVGGHRAGVGEVFRVPAGRTWRGTVTLHLAASAPPNSPASVQNATLNIAGAGATPAAGTLLEVVVALPMTAATATEGRGDSASLVVPEVVIVAGGADAVVSLAASAGATAARASGRGVLL